MKSFNDLEIYKLLLKLAIKVHHMTLKLPDYELFEQGSQIRRSSKSIKDTIAEGYGRKRYKKDFVRYIIYSHGSCNECISQLEMIKKIHKLNEIDTIIEEYDHLGRMINKFIHFIDEKWL